MHGMARLCWSSHGCHCSRIDEPSKQHEPGSLQMSTAGHLYNIVFHSAGCFWTAFPECLTSGISVSLRMTQPMKGPASAASPLTHAIYSRSGCSKELRPRGFECVIITVMHATQMQLNIGLCLLFKRELSAQYRSHAVPFQLRAESSQCSMFVI